MMVLMKWGFSALLLALLLACGRGGEKSAAAETDNAARARDLAQKFLIVDTHVDLPYRLQRNYEDVSQRTESGDFDFVRAKEGGLNAPFMSIYVPASYQEEGGAKAFADGLIDMVVGFQDKWPDKFAVATSVADVRDQFGKGLVSLPMGMENGAPIEGDLANLKHFHDRGIRYITLTHSKNNHICDSSYDEERRWNGLSPFGRELVLEMNRIGMMVDVSHVSDDAFYQIMELVKAPPIASHSSCRAFTPDFERNMSDEMIELLAKKGGVVMINFGSTFISGEIRTKADAMRQHIRAYLEENNLTREDEHARTYIADYVKANRAFADVADVADHIDHVVKLAGIDYVGFGSDFDGVGDTLPTGLKDASQFPNLIKELLDRGYTEEDIEKICSGNIMRVWSEVERAARELQAGGAE